MSYLYILENLENNKKFVGKTALPQWCLKLLLFDILDNEDHYNEYLQKEWYKHNFKISFIESEDCIHDCDEIIENEQLLNPLYGYNVYADLKVNRGRFRRNDIFNDDICLIWCFFPKIQFMTRTFNIQRNTISNRLSNFNLFDNIYYSRSITRYEDYYWTSARMLYMDNKCLTANQILNRMDHRYDISAMLRITPRKISKFYVTNGIATKDDKQKGCLIFCPKRNKKL